MALTGQMIDRTRPASYHTAMTPPPEDIAWQKSLSGLSQRALNEKIVEAVDQKSLWRVEAALAAGASAQAENNQPIRKAAVSDQFHIAVALIEAGANIHVNDGEPLAWAARGGNAAIVELLIASGAKADEKTHAGRRARSWAEDYKQANILSLFDHADDIRTHKANNGLSLSERITAAIDRGEPLPMDDIRKEGVTSDIYLYVLGDRNRLDLVFHPKEWLGDPDGMAKLHARLPRRFKEQIDLPSKVSALGAYTAKAKNPPPKLKF